MPVIGIPLETIPIPSGLSSYTSSESLIYKGFFEEIELTGSFEIPSGEDFTDVLITSSIKGFRYSTPEIISGGAYSFSVKYGALQAAGTITVSAPWGDIETFKIAVGTPSFLTLLKQSFLNPAMKVTDYQLVASIVSGAMYYAAMTTNRTFPDAFPSVLYGGKFPVETIQSYVDSTLVFSMFADEETEITLDVSGKITGDLIAAELQTQLRAIGEKYQAIEVVWTGEEYILNTGIIDEDCKPKFNYETNLSLLRALCLHPHQGAYLLPSIKPTVKDSSLLTGALSIVSAMYNKTGSEGFASLTVGEMSYTILVDTNPHLKGVFSANRRLF